jgi:hypothetical protein
VLLNNGFSRFGQFNRFNRFSIHTEPTEPTNPTKLTKPILVFLLLGLAASAHAVIYQVGPTRSFTQFSQIPALQPGDIVEVDGDATYNSILVRNSGTATAPVTLRGLRVNGRRPVITGGTRTVEFRQSRYVLFEGFDITNGSDACVWINAADVTMRDTVVHDCPKHGILGTDYDTGNITLEFVEVYHAGSQPVGENLKHPIYIATDSEQYPNATLRIAYCYLHDNNAGEGIKSRSRRNEIYYNWLQAAPGTNNFYQMVLYGPEEPVAPGIREDGDVVGNVFIGVAGSGVASSVRLGSDGHSYSEGRYRFLNNTFVTFHTAPRDFLRVFGDIESIELINNVFYSVNNVQGLVNLTDAGWTQGEVISGRNNWFSNTVGGIPASLSGTLRGTHPGFAQFATVGTFDPRLVSNSVLINQGSSSTTGSNSFPVPNPLVLPQFLPPLRLSTEFTTLMPTPRASMGALDIGAFEWASGTTSACDLNRDSATNVSDVQLCANQAIGAMTCTTGDINQDSTCNVIDVQRVVNTALGGLCVVN